MEPPRQEQSQRAVSRSPGANKTKKVVTKSKYRPVRIRHTGTMKSLARGDKHAVKSLTKKLNIHDDALKILKTYLDEKEKTDGAETAKRMDALDAKIEAIAKQIIKTPTEKVKEKLEYFPVLFGGWYNGVVYDPMIMVRSDVEHVLIKPQVFHIMGSNGGHPIGITRVNTRYLPNNSGISRSLVIDLDIFSNLKRLKSVHSTMTNTWYTEYINHGGRIRCIHNGKLVELPDAKSIETIFKEAYPNIEFSII